MDKLNEESARLCAGQLIDAIERIARRHGWNDGDLIAVTAMALPELIGGRIGAPQTIEFLRDMADEIEAKLLRGG